MLILDVLFSLAYGWVFYYVFIHILYYAIGFILEHYLKRHHKHLPTNRITPELVSQQKNQSELAFPLYCTVPAIGDLFRQYGFSQVCYSMTECGGIVTSLINFAIYFVLVEAGVFWIHYWWLHEFEWGKRVLNHKLHHSHRTASEMNGWTGYAFEAVDGAAQGIPFVLFQFVVPVPFILTLIAGFTVGLWTMYIHVGFPHAPWPLMGADYHYIHHIYNRYNYGLFTIFWDTVFSTVKHPSPDTLKQAAILADAGPPPDAGHY